eukprot:3719879-Rhodomonas_salina.1
MSGGSGVRERAASARVQARAGAASPGAVGGLGGLPRRRSRSLPPRTGHPAPSSPGLRVRRRVR